MASEFFADSFDTYVTADILSKWSRLNSSPIISSGNGRRGTASLRFDSVTDLVFKSVPTSTATVAIGFAIRFSTVPSSTYHLISFMDGSNAHVVIDILSDGSLRAIRCTTPTIDYVGNAAFGGTTLGTTAAGVITSGVFYHLEVVVTVDDSAGAVQLLVNGTSQFNLTSIDTRQSSTATITQVGLGGSTSVDIDIDDFTMRWTAATLWGDCRVDVSLPTAEGATIMFVPSTGSDNSATVDEAAPNGDTDYNSAANVNDLDTLVMQNAPAGAIIKGVQAVQYSKKTDAGACDIAPVLRHSGTDYVGTSVSVSTYYAYQTQGYLQNPGTAATWTESGVNGIELGYKKTA